jgi:hypothetical protein
MSKVWLITGSGNGLPTGGYIRYEYTTIAMGSMASRA